MPLGECEIAITVAPARRYASGATKDDAPFAQSTTIFIPLRGVVTPCKRCVK